MVDTRPFLPVSSSDGSNPSEPLANGRKPMKVQLSIFFGLLAVGLLAALLTSNNGSDFVTENEHGPLAPSTTKPEPLRPLSRGPAAGVSEKSNRLFADENTVAFPWNNSMLSWQRTAFHFQPERNWMNDPNGPLFYKGWYHFFYQYNPHAPVWGDIVWGHAVSKDLIHWLHLPLAMVADHTYDKSGVWTGSATFLPDGKIVMLYTGSNAQAVQVQNLAYPADHSDPLLINWVKYSGNPVLVPPPGILSKDFRDPTTAWLTSEGKWRFAIGSKVNKTGVALVYDTKDFINYEKLDGFLRAVDGTGMWECVDFFPVSKTEENGLDTSVNTPDVKHVMKVSLDDDRHDYYAVGTYHEKNVTFVPDDPTIDVGIGLRYDYGVYYAAKTFYDQNKNRRVLWGWIGESDSEAADLQKGWASVQSIPRTVLLDKKTVGPATQLDIIAEFKIENEAFEKATGSNVSFSCSSSGGAKERGALGPFGLLVLADDSLSEQTPVYFYIAKGSDGNLKTFFCNDQSRSSVASDVNKQIYGSMVPVLKGENLSLRVLVDHSIIESFAQGGRTVITSRVYPTRAIYGAAKLFLFNNATEAGVSASLKIWQMNSAFIRPYPHLDNKSQ
ncbi:hypothetical protein V6N13_076978 [Hibiscus sabdariffa]|uniref:beta-fructofuranosidase n=1 Tax=Hibiscus sabdariffa TaxID=183260 RepID=A0ABR2CMH1_9ROSI